MFVVEMYAQVRRIRLDARLSSPRRPPKHRVRCQRMPRAGMLIQLDGSYHRWLADHIPPFTLLLAVDDALFWEPEDSRNYFCKGRRENVPRGRLDRRVWAVENCTAWCLP